MGMPTGDLALRCLSPTHNRPTPCSGGSALPYYYPGVCTSARNRADLSGIESVIPSLLNRSRGKAQAERK